MLSDGSLRQGRLSPQAICSVGEDNYACGTGVGKTADCLTPAALQTGVGADYKRCLDRPIAVCRREWMSLK
jgi:hypothetical protein